MENNTHIFAIWIEDENYELIMACETCRSVLLTDEKEQYYCPNCKCYAFYYDYK